MAVSFRETWEVKTTSEGMGGRDVRRREQACFLRMTQRDEAEEVIVVYTRNQRRKLTTRREQTGRKFCSCVGIHAATYKHGFDQATSVAQRAVLDAPRLTPKNSTKRATFVCRRTVTLKIPASQAGAAHELKRRK